jgi:predicted nucleotidyltransferase
MSDLEGSYIEGYRVLFTTVVGSNAWNMQQPDSDIDYNHVYLRETKDILSGIGGKATLPQMKGIEKDGIKWEAFSQEIGHLINKLLDGNCNAIWAVTSPIISFDDSYGLLSDLTEIVENNLAKNVYGSVWGMAISQMKDREKRPNFSQKGWKTALRTLNFGIEILKGNGVNYRGIFNPIIKEDIDRAFISLDEAYKESKLPEKPDEKPFRDFLLKVRLMEFGGLI